MCRQHPAAVVVDTCTTVDSDHHGQPPAADSVAPVGQVVRSWAVEALVAAYGGDAHRLLTDLADLLEASVAYVDRPTVEAHLERPLSDGEWSAVASYARRMAGRTASSALRRRAISTFSRDEGTSTSSWPDPSALRTRVRKSATGSVSIGYQLDLVMPGT